jgi:hypothetical protein
MYKFNNMSTNWKSSSPPILLDRDNPASMDFMERRTLAQLLAQDTIVETKTEKSYHVNKHRKETQTLQWEIWLLERTDLS